MTPAEESALLEKYRPLVRTVARSVSRDAARDEDALQCGLIGLWEAAERWDGQRPFAPLARRCIRCNIMDYLRGRPPPSEALPEDFPAPEPPIPEENRAFRLLIFRIFPRRSLERRVALLLLEGKKKAEIARRLHVSRSTVYRSARRVWRQIAQYREGRDP